MLLALCLSRLTSGLRVWSRRSGFALAVPRSRAAPLPVATGDLGRPNAKSRSNSRFSVWNRSCNHQKWSPPHGEAQGDYCPTTHGVANREVEHCPNALLLEGVFCAASDRDHESAAHAAGNCCEQHTRKRRPVCITLDWPCQVSPARVTDAAISDAAMRACAVRIGCTAV